MRKAPEKNLQVRRISVVEEPCHNGAASRVVKQSAMVSVNENAKSVGPVLGSLNSMEVGCKLSTRVPRILRVLFEWLVNIVARFLNSMKVSISRARVMQEPGGAGFE